MHSRPIVAAALLILLALTNGGTSLASSAVTAAPAPTIAPAPCAPLVFIRLTDHAHSELVVLDTVGTHLRQFTDTPVIAPDPTWSPHDTPIPFVCDDRSRLADTGWPS